MQSLPAGKVSIAAHSLGNLVMWDALRLHKAHGGSQLVQNAVSIQGALLEESFWPQANVAYTTTTDPGHVITYTVDQLKRHSWTFWFQQTGQKATDSSRKFINSRTGADFALKMMKLWHAASTRSKYNRDNSTAYRTPEENSLPEIVALMKIFQRRPRILLEPPDSYRDTLTDPIGITDTPVSDNCNATSWGWRNDEHSDMKTLPLYDIHRWFSGVFKSETEIIK